MTSSEEELQRAWRELVEAETEHDQPHAQRAWQRIQELQAAVARRLGGGGAVAL